MVRAPLSPWASAAMLELAALSTALVAYLLLLLLGISLGPQIYATTAFLGLLVLLSWRRSGGGMHPVFLLLSTLLLFQGGHLLAYCLKPLEVQPLQVLSSNGLFDPSLASQEITLLVLMAAAFSIYVPFRLSETQRLPVQAPLPRLARPLLPIFLLTLPFLVWKNYLYLRFVSSHGGYMAIYLAHDQLIAQAGTVVRLLSRVCTNTFLVYFCYERAGRRLAIAAALFFAASVMELLIGLRGDVTLTMIGCIFLWKLKRGTHFTARSLLLLAALVALGGQLIAGTRTGGEMKGQMIDVPELFLDSQGTSLGVPEAAISGYRLFAPHRFLYFLNDFRSPLVPMNDWAQGQLLDKDINLYLDPLGDAAGYSIGGSYLADGYVYGRILGVIAISLLVGLVLLHLPRYLNGWMAPYALSMILCLIYLPRAPLIGQVVWGVLQWGFISVIVLIGRAMVALPHLMEALSKAKNSATHNPATGSSGAPL